jgi:DNA end-binding protein Ku
VRQQYVAAPQDAPPAAPPGRVPTQAPGRTPQPVSPRRTSEAAARRAALVDAPPADGASRNADADADARPGAGPDADASVSSGAGQTPDDARVVERHAMAKGYEFEKDRFVVFTPAELKALEEPASDAIEIVSFLPADAVDPLYLDKAYLLAPDRRGERSYALLLEAMRRSGRCALARWAWRGRPAMVQIRAAEGGMVLHALRYAEEVRRPQDLRIARVDVGAAELELALRLVEQGAEEAYDAARFVDEHKERVLAAVERKIAGREVVSRAREPAAPATGAQVIDLMEALRASLAPAKEAPARRPARGAERQRTPPPARPKTSRR